MSVYNPSLGSALAVFAPLQVEKGHWVEVQPRVDPADSLPAAVKVYVLPLPPGDAALEALADRGLVRVHGGAGAAAVVTLEDRPALGRALAPALEMVAREAVWLSEHAVRNAFPGLSDLAPAALERRGRVLAEQRTRAGRIEPALHVSAHAAGSTDPALARGLRLAARGFGAIAGFLGDDSGLDLAGPESHAQLRDRLGRVANAARAAQPRVALARVVEEAKQLFRHYFTAA